MPRGVLPDGVRNSGHRAGNDIRMCVIALDEPTEHRNFGIPDDIRNIFQSSGAGPVSDVTNAEIRKPTEQRWNRPLMSRRR